MSHKHLTHSWRKPGSVFKETFLLLNPAEIKFILSVEIYNLYVQINRMSLNNDFVTILTFPKIEMKLL